MKSTHYKALLTASIFALSSATAYAYNYETPTLYEQTAGEIVFVTGGIGENEIAELEASKSSYSLNITNSDKGGAYVSDTTIAIHDAKGNEVLNTSTGPSFFRPPWVIPYWTC